MSGYLGQLPFPPTLIRLPYLSIGQPYMPNDLDSTLAQMQEPPDTRREIARFLIPGWQVMHKTTRISCQAESTTLGASLLKAGLANCTHDFFG